MKQAIRMLLILLLAAAAANIGHTAETLSEIEHTVIRLHILADSDETDAQMQKLLVRDALLEHASDWIPADADFAAGCDALRKKLPEIRQTAQDTLYAAGSRKTVRVSLEQTVFPTRKYGSMTLPAGEYEALRVEIGSAEGQNWWCVMYPAMCIPASSETEAESVLPDDARDLALHPERYEVRLKCVDTARAVIRRVRELTEQAEAASPDRETAPQQQDCISEISIRSRYCSRSRCFRSCCRSRTRTEESE